jgi:hypothetical protein
MYHTFPLFLFQIYSSAFILSTYRWAENAAVATSPQAFISCFKFFLQQSLVKVIARVKLLEGELYDENRCHFN